MDPIGLCPPVETPSGRRSGPRSPIGLCPPVETPIGRRSGPRSTMDPIGLCPPVVLYGQPSRPNLHPITLDDEMINMAKRRSLHGNDIHNYNDNVAESIPRDIVIIFINSLVKEIQYIMFLKHLRKECKIIKHDSSPDIIFKVLFYGQEKFCKFDREAVWRAISERIVEVRAKYKAVKLYEYRSLLSRIESIKWDSSLSSDLNELSEHEFSGLNFDDREKEIWQYKRSLYRSCTIGFKNRDIFAREPPPKHDEPYTPIDLISNLVFEILEKDYVMDTDAAVELVKMKTADPNSYEDHFINDHSRVEYLKNRSGIIRVENLSLDVTTNTIFNLFSPCGQIAHMELTSEGKSQTAFVTFMYLEAINRALLVKDKILKQSQITSISEYKLTYVNKSAVEEDTASNFDNALLKYRKCTQYQDLDKYFNQLCVGKPSRADAFASNLLMYRNCTQSQAFYEQLEKYHHET